MMIKKIVFVSLMCLVISCAFSTTGGMSTPKRYNKPVLISTQDTIIKYVERPPLTKAQQAHRDSLLRKYIGSIIKPFVDDLKYESGINTNNLTKFIQSQGSRLDSINNLRYHEVYAYQLASIQRDSFLIQTILKDKRIDSLQKAVLRIEKTNLEYAQIGKGVNELILVIRNLAVYTILGFFLIFISLSLFVEWLKNKRRRRYKLIKQDE